MSDFFKFVFASCLGVMLASVVGVVLFGSVLGGMASSFGGGDKVTVKPNSVLRLTLNQALPELTNNIEQDLFNLNSDGIVGLHDLTRTIAMAKDDDKIKGILLDLNGVSMGQATASVVRDALVDFKESDKFIIANAKYYSQGTYYMASVADSILMNPMGGVDFRGFAAQIPFFKDMLDRLDVKVQVYYAGQFKSATEPFRLEKMSQQNRLQVREYLEGLYGQYLEDVAESRNTTPAKLRAIADNYELKNAEDALRLGFVDRLVYKDQVLDILRKKAGLEEDDKIPTVSLAKYAKKLKKNLKAKGRIAVIHAEGSIVDGMGAVGSIGGDKYGKLIRKIRNDDKVKAIVLRVNSGGGSALASEIMWRELLLAKEQGLPVIVSMGNAAASGGYYIACMADTIVAEPNTITGSIGVFSLIPSLQQTMKKKVGVTFDTVRTARHSVGIGLFYDVSEEEGKILQASTNEIYETFLKRVADGRGMTRDEVHAIAQGRVWTGVKGKEIGLVDVLGGLDTAIDIAAEKAGLESYRLAEYPKIKEPLQQFLDDLQGKDKASIQKAMIKSELGEAYQYYEMAQELKNMKGVQAKMPFEVEVKW